MSIDACAEFVRRGDPDRFLAAMAAPVSARRVLFPLYAFNVEVSRAPWVTAEPMIAEMRLQWWRDALGEIEAERPVRAHEVTRPLADVIDAEGARILDRLVEARRWDIHSAPYTDATDFAGYLDATSSGLAWVTARALGCGTEDEAHVRGIGWASGLANWFLAIPELEARGRIPLVDGRPEAVRDLANQGLERLHAARPSRVAKPALLATWRARAFLRQAAKHPERVGHGALSQSEFVRRVSLFVASF